MDDDRGRPRTLSSFLLELAIVGERVENFVKLVRTVEGCW